MSLILATDSAYPYDFGQAPAGCQVIMGYVGRQGYTPHVWTMAEANTARAHGFRWWPIVTGISQGPTGATDGLINAQTMIANAPAYGVLKSEPVFMDLEPTAYDSDPAGAQAAMAAFRNAMHQAGYARAYVYCVQRPGIDWVANWTNVRPVSLPAGIIGWQYGGNQSPPSFDLSVFDSSLLGSNGGGTLTDAQVSAINVHTDTEINNLAVGVTKRIQEAANASHSDIGNLAVGVTDRIQAVSAKIDQLLARPSGGGGTGASVDVAALATALKAAGVGSPSLTDAQVSQIATAVAAALPGGIGQQVAQAFFGALMQGVPTLPTQ